MENLINFNIIDLVTLAVFAAVDALWSFQLVSTFALLGLVFTIMLGFAQIRYLPTMYRLASSSNRSREGMSALQSLLVSVSGRVGTGNIVGVSAAISVGGPGAVFWMWVTAFFGCASSFIESVTGQLYKISYRGQYRAGQALYMYKILLRSSGSQSLATSVALLVAFVAMLTFTAFLTGIHSSAMFAAFEQANVSNTTACIIILTVFLIVISDGIRSIALFSKYMVAIMGTIYMIFTLYIIILYYQSVPGVFYLIFTSAFDNNAILGGIFGTAFRSGVMRGVLSNEAGLGSSGPHIGGAAEVSHPAEQGFVQSIAVYVDTMIFCTLTALIILLTDTYAFQYNGHLIYQGSGIADAAIEANKYIYHASLNALNNPILTSSFVTLMIFLFAISSLSSNYYIAETNAEIIDYFKPQAKLLGKSWLLLLCKFLAVLVILITAFVEKEKTATAFAIADLGTGMMVLFNIMGLTMGAPFAYRIYKDYHEKLRSTGFDKTKETSLPFNPRDIGIKDADFWNERY